MVSRSYHESLWQGVPEGLDPADFELRRAFLLDGTEAVGDVGARPPRVLDVGCGEGRFAAELAGAGFVVVGVDVAEEPLRRARAKHPELDFRLVPSEAPWPLPDASFDVVWAGETIEHVLDTAGWLSEVRRVMRSGARLLLSTPAHGRLVMLGLVLSGRRFDTHFDPRGDHLRFYTLRTLHQLLADFGFEDIDVRRAGGRAGPGRVLLASARRSRF